MTFVVLFEDNPSANPGIRKTHMSAHLAFLEGNASKVEAAGPLITRSGAGAGGLWLVEADSADEVEKLVHEDPFWPTGLRQDFTILEWRQVFADGRRLISPQ